MLDILSGNSTLAYFADKFK